MRFVLFTMLALTALPVQAEEPVQSILLRAVTLTCKLDESIAFYRDILGQTVVDDSTRDAQQAAAYLDILPTSKMRLVLMKGSASYPGGDIAGGRIAFIGIDDPAAPACKTTKPRNRRAVQGDGIYSVRVANLDEIVKRAKAKGAEILFEPRRSGSGLARNMMLFDPNGRIVELFELTFAPPPD